MSWIRVSLTSISWWSSEARIISFLTSSSSSMFSLTVRAGWNVSGLLWGLVFVGSGIRPRNRVSSRCSVYRVFVALLSWCEDNSRWSNIELIYGGGLGGGGGGRAGQDVVRRVTGGDRSVGGASVESEELELEKCRIVAVCCCITWVRFCVLTNEGLCCESVSTTRARLTGWRLLDLLWFRISILWWRCHRPWLLTSYCILM